MFIEENKAESIGDSQHFSNALLPAGMGSLNVLFAGEESQACTKAFRDLGHNAFSCDLKECSGGHPEWHIVLDMKYVIEGGKFLLENWK
jgi:hypothetical protein